MATEITINENSIIYNGEEYIKKQPTPKDGEVWYVEVQSGNKYVFIARENGYLTGNYATTNIVHDFTDIPKPEEDNARVVDDYEIMTLLRATPNKEALLHAKLAEKGKVWNAEKKVLEDLPKPLIYDALTIFWNDKKSDAIIGKYLRADQRNLYTHRRSDGSGFKNAIPFESIEQYKEFIKG